MAGDKIQAIGADSVNVGRIIRGMENIFKGGKLSLLEGGYGWYLTLKERHPEILGIFVSPFSQQELDWRGGNNSWVSTTFPTPAERHFAFQAYANEVQNLQKEFDLTAANDESTQARTRIQEFVKRQMQMEANYRVLELPQFIGEVNARLQAAAKTSTLSTRS